MNVINIFLQNRYNKDILINKLNEYHFNINKLNNIINSLINYPEYNINIIDTKIYNICCQYFINILLIKNKNKINSKDLYKFNSFKYNNIFVSKDYKDITLLFEVINYMFIIKNNLFKKGLINNNLFDIEFNYKENDLNNSLIYNLSFNSSHFNNSFYNYLYFYIPNFLLSSINMVNNINYINNDNKDILTYDFYNYKQIFKKLFNEKDKNNLLKTDNKMIDETNETNETNKTNETNEKNLFSNNFKTNNNFNYQYNNFNKPLKQYIFQKIIKINDINKLIQLYDKNNNLSQYNIQNIRLLYYYIKNSLYNIKLSNMYINLFYAIPLKIYPVYIINNLLLTIYYENLITNNYNFINEYKIIYDNNNFSFIFELNKNNEYYNYIKNNKFKKIKLTQFNLYQELINDINFNKIKEFPKYFYINTTLNDPNIYKIYGFTKNVYNNYTEKLIKTNNIINIFQRNITINKKLFTKHKYYLKKFIIFDNYINDYIMFEIKNNKFYKIDNKIKEINTINLIDDYNNSIYADNNNVYDNIKYYKIVIVMYKMK